jgi:uroporphyrinogen-III synthase
MTPALKDKKIVVTRDIKQSREFIKKIRKFGGIVVNFPVVCIEQVDDWYEADQAIEHLDSYNWIMFTSINGAKYFLKRLKKKHKKIGPQKIAVISDKIAAFIKKQGIQIELVSEKSHVSGLIKDLEHLSLNAKRILLPGSNLSDNLLMNYLAIRGCDVTKVQVYRTVANSKLNGRELYLSLKNSEIHCLTFFSTSAFKYFIEVIDNDIVSILHEQKTAIAVIGDTTANAINEKGLEVLIKPEHSSEENLLEAIVQYFNLNHQKDQRDSKL